MALRARPLFQNCYRQSHHSLPYQQLQHSKNELFSQQIDYGIGLTNGKFTLSYIIATHGKLLDIGCIDSQVRRYPKICVISRTPTKISFISKTNFQRIPLPMPLPIVITLDPNHFQIHCHSQWPHTSECPPDNFRRHTR
jgi:hypothetical protein